MIAWLKVWLRHLVGRTEKSEPAKAALPLRGKVSRMAPGESVPEAKVGLRIFKAKEKRWYSEKEAKEAGIMADKNTKVTVERSET